MIHTGNPPRTVEGGAAHAQHPGGLGHVPTRFKPGRPGYFPRPVSRADNTPPAMVNLPNFCVVLWISILKIPNVLLRLKSKAVTSQKVRVVGFLFRSPHIFESFHKRIAYTLIILGSNPYGPRKKKGREIHVSRPF